MLDSKAIIEFPDSVIVLPGEPGLRWRDDVNAGQWQAGTDYAVGDAVFHDPSSFRAIMAHVATAENEPGIGTEWTDVWRYVARGGGAPTPTDPPGKLNFSKRIYSGLLALIEDI